MVFATCKYVQAIDYLRASAEEKEVGFLRIGLSLNHYYYCSLFLFL